MSASAWSLWQCKLFLSIPVSLTSGESRVVIVGLAKSQPASLGAESLQDWGSGHERGDLNRPARLSHAIFGTGHPDCMASRLPLFWDSYGKPKPDSVLSRAGNGTRKHSGAVAAWL